MNDPSPKNRYHHGDLANAMIEVSLECAREGGPNSITLREAARRTGVSAPAAYRHFTNRDDLVNQAAQRASEILGQALIDASTEAEDPLSRLRLVGGAYIEFALNEPGLLETAYYSGIEPEVAQAARRPDPGDPNPFEVLVDCLDDLERDGCIAPGRREGAEIVAWSAVHGLAMLLRSANTRPGEADLQTKQVLDGVQHALGIEV